MSGEQQFDQMIWAIINYKKSKKKKKIVKIGKPMKEGKNETEDANNIPGTLYIHHLTIPDAGSSILRRKKLRIRDVDK